MLASQKNILEIFTGAGKADLAH